MNRGEEEVVGIHNAHEGHTCWGFSLLLLDHSIDAVDYVRSIRASCLVYHSCYTRVAINLRCKGVALVAKLDCCHIAQTKYLASGECADYNLLELLGKLLATRVAHRILERIARVLAEVTR